MYQKQPPQSGEPDQGVKHSAGKENVSQSDGKVNPYRWIPPEMLSARQWICWKYVQRPGEAKATKEPRVACDPLQKASTTRREHWASFEEAQAALLTHGLDGLGYVLTGTGLCGVDLDDCLDGRGRLLPWAQEIVDRFESVAYIEESPSGRGAHIITRGTLPDDSWHKLPIPNTDSHLEMYDEGRYFTMTGRTFYDFSGLDIADGQNALDWLQAKYRPEVVESGPQTSGVSMLNAEDVLRLTRNDQKFQDLFAGRWEEYFTSQSEADLSLMTKLAFYSGRDSNMMDSLFRESGLYRAKYEREDYRLSTINKALQTCSEIHPAQKDCADEFDCIDDTEDDRGAKRKRFTLLGRDELLSRNNAKSYLVKGVIPDQGIGVLHGPSGVAKSFFTIDCCMSVASEPQWCARKVNNAPVVYLCAEGQAAFGRCEWAP